jgi:hypothetical protein
MALSDDNLDDLRSAAFDYVTNYGLPESEEARDWLQSLTSPDITAEQAFTPLYESYFAGTGQFEIGFWQDITFNLENITLRPDASGGIYFNFDFDFDSGDDSPGEGARGAHGYF